MILRKKVLLTLALVIDTLYMGLDAMKHTFHAHLANSTNFIDDVNAIHFGSNYTF